jgi:hypothetical protein
MGCAVIPGEPADMGVNWSEGHLAIQGRALDAETADKLIETLITARREAFGRPEAMAPVVEIIEPGHTSSDSMGGSMIMPREVRINGQRLLTQGGVIVHEMRTDPKDCARITVTLPVRMLIVAAEGDLAGSAG